MRQYFSRYPNGDNLAAHLVKKFDLQPLKAHVRAVDALLRLVGWCKAYPRLKVYRVSVFTFTWLFHRFVTVKSQTAVYE